MFSGFLRRYVNARVNVARGLAKSVYEKYIDPKTQVPYWHNPRSGTTVWVKPTTLGSEDVEVKVAAVDPEQEYVLLCCRSPCAPLHFLAVPKRWRSKA